MSGKKTHNVYQRYSHEGDPDFLRTLSLPELLELVVRSKVARDSARKDETLRVRYVLAAKFKYYAYNSFYFSPKNEDYLIIMEDFISTFKAEQEGEEAANNLEMEDDDRNEANIQEKTKDSENAVPNGSGVTFKKNAAGPTLKEIKLEKEAKNLRERGKELGANASGGVQKKVTEFPYASVASIQKVIGELKEKVVATEMMIHKKIRSKLNTNH